MIALYAQADIIVDFGGPADSNVAPLGIEQQLYEFDLAAAEFVVALNFAFLAPLLFDAFPKSFRTRI